jgi:hypothetical protein
MDLNVLYKTISSTSVSLNLRKTLELSWLQTLSSFSVRVIQC